MLDTFQRPGKNLALTRVPEYEMNSSSKKRVERVNIFTPNSRRRGDSLVSTPYVSMRQRMLKSMLNLAGTRGLQIAKKAAGTVNSWSNHTWAKAWHGRTVRISDGMQRDALAPRRSWIWMPPISQHPLSFFSAFRSQSLAAL